MWVGQLMRGMLGEPQPDQAKALELRVGQIVRGVVLQLLDGKDALVSLAGVQVRARLETPLVPGQSALLQVMPESSAGTIVLRQADAGFAQPSEATLRELMKLLGLPDKRWAAELALDLRRGGYPVTRETGAALKQAAAARPADVPEAEWMRAAATAWKRGLPVTERTVAALRQAMFGKPVGELLEALRGQLAALAGQAGPTSGGAAGFAPGGTLPAAAARVLALLAEGETLLAGPAGRPVAPAAAGRTASAAGTPGAAPAAGAAGSQAGIAAAQSGAAGMAVAAGAPASAQLSRPAAGQAPQTADASGGAGQPATAAGGASLAAGGLARQASAEAVNARQQGAARQAQQAAAPQSGNWIHGLLKWLGVDYEKQLSQLIGARGEAAGGQPEAAARQAAEDARSGAAAPGKEAAAGPGAGAGVPGMAERMAAPAGRGIVPLLPQTAEPQPAQTGGTGFAAGETLKQALLSLASTDDVPAALRETAQQLVQQITGQQLLLSPEKNGVLFSHMTLFIPFRGEDGGTTAQITIQSRRGRKGELDPDNCRLLFDLRMKHLGDTVVDVQVADRFVSLNLWNDHPAASRLMESARDEAAEALGRVGYQLSSMRVKPFPDEASRNAGKDPAAPPPDPAVYAGKPYKGVDYRA
jgi:hypothetical protein